MFELTYRCNFRCRHCYVPQSYRKYNELKTKEVFSLLNQLKDIGCFYLGFTGGEPFIREDVIEILWYAKRCGFQLIIYTNGSLINEKIVEQLVRLRPNKIDITIPAMSKDAFERISGVSGSRDKVFRTIELLHKNGVNLGFKSCVLTENENEIKEIQDFAASLGALHRLDDVLLPRLDGSKEPYRSRGKLGLLGSLESGEQCDLTNTTTVTKITNPTKLRGLPLSHELFKCGVGRSQVAITPLGELKMCLMIDYPKYKILKGSLEEAWEKLKKLVENIKLDENYQCDECELEPYCKWCPARGWLENRNFTTCDPESRRRAEIIKESYEDRS
ncbi:MAG: radical SAM protein [bacterium]